MLRSCSCCCLQCNLQPSFAWNFPVSAISSGLCVCLCVFVLVCGVGRVVSGRLMNSVGCYNTGSSPLRQFGCGLGLAEIGVSSKINARPSIHQQIRVAPTRMQASRQSHWPMPCHRTNLQPVPGRRLRQNSADSMASRDPEAAFSQPGSGTSSKRSGSAVRPEYGHGFQQRPTQSPGERQRSEKRRARTLPARWRPP